jgi:hypothetical protein
MYELDEWNLANQDIEARVKDAVLIMVHLQADPPLLPALVVAANRVPLT